MPITRRKTLQLAAFNATALAMGLNAISPATAQEQGAAEMHTIATGNGDVRITPISHASLALSTAHLTIYIDPIGDPQDYAALPPPNIILITHEHGDHFNVDTLTDLTAGETTLVANQPVFDKLPHHLQVKTNVMKNGDIAHLFGTKIEAIPAYNTTPDRQKYHPKGRDNGYVLTIMGTRIYIAGDTEDTPEMRALQNISLAFLPMNLPYTMDIDQAADATLAFAPKMVYPYHYRGSDTAEFKSLVAVGNKDIDVRLYDWYTS